MVFQGRGKGKGKTIIDRLFSALHVQIAGLPPIRTVLVFYLFGLRRISSVKRRFLLRHHHYPSVYCSRSAYMSLVRLVVRSMNTLLSYLNVNTIPTSDARH